MRDFTARLTCCFLALLRVRLIADLVFGMTDTNYVLLKSVAGQNRVSGGFVNG